MVSQGCCHLVKALLWAKIQTFLKALALHLLGLIALNICSVISNENKQHGHISSILSLSKGSSKDQSIFAYKTGPYHEIIPVPKPTDFSSYHTSHSFKAHHALGTERSEWMGGLRSLRRLSFFQVSEN